MEYLKNSVKNPAFIICVILIMINFVFGNYMMEKKFLQYQQSVIGDIYLQNPESGKVYLKALFMAEPSEENLKAGEKAMVQYGYTIKGLDYFMNKSRMYSVCFLTGGVYLLLLAAVISVLNSDYKKCRKNMRVLLNRIGELEKAREKGEYLQVQNSRIQTFIENIAHQIKTPVSRIMTSLDLIQEETKNDRQRERLLECISHLETVRQLMVRLLDIGRMEAGKVLFRKEYMLIEELLQDCVQTSCGEQNKMTVRIVPEESETVYYGDYEWLREALVNILKNCLEHDSSNVPIEITCRKEQEYYMIQIRDHGTGLMEEDIPNLFDRFYLPENVKNNHIGIGLNLAKLIIDAHFGTIHAVNHEDGGAVFNIMLPIYALKNEKI